MLQVCECVQKLIQYECVCGKMDRSVCYLFTRAHNVKKHTIYICDMKKNFIHIYNMSKELK
jgi:hypothetical protein